MTRWEFSIIWLAHAHQCQDCSTQQVLPSFQQHYSDIHIYNWNAQLRQNIVNKTIYVITNHYCSDWLITNGLTNVKMFNSCLCKFCFLLKCKTVSTKWLLMPTCMFVILPGIIADNDEHVDSEYMRQHWRWMAFSDVYLTTIVGRAAL